MSLFTINLALATIWVILMGQYAPAQLASQFILGFLLGYALIWMARPFLQQTHYFRATSRKELPTTFAQIPVRAWRWIRFTLIFLRELIKANIDIVIGVLSPLEQQSPGILAIPLDVTTDAEITLLANMITLTPGTLSLDLSIDRKVLFVYFFKITDPEQEKQAIKDGFERMVREVLQ